MKFFKTVLILFAISALPLTLCARNNDISAAPHTVADSAGAPGGQRNIQVKLSALVAVGIVNPAVEFKVFDKFTVQLEALGVFYSKDFLGTGKPLVLGAGFAEMRYYPKQVFKGFYVGPNIGFGAYKLNKGLVLRYTDDYNYDCYQVGSNLMTGLTIGYTFNINEHWSIEASWSGGFQHSRYTGFKRDTPDDPYVMYVDVNGSAEWPPFYKGGIFIAYRF